MLVFFKSLIITLVFEKNANIFAENWQKSQENCDHNIDPGLPQTNKQDFFDTGKL
jgi:hypothetical protein